MTITTQDGLVAAMATAQGIPLFRQSVTSVAGGWFQTLQAAGNPGAGVLAGTSTAAGVVPTSATAGCPPINAFTGANIGYLLGLDYGGATAARLRVCDMLFKAGPYNFNSNVTLAAQPSYSARIPGADYKGTEIWVECVTAFTGNMSVAVTYTNQDGTTGRSTGTVATGVAPTVGRMIQLPLQSGDTGVQKIESVVGSVATVGTFNALVLRPLRAVRVRSANDGGTYGADLTDMPQVFADSALIVQAASDSTSTGIFEMILTIGNG